MSPYQPDQRGFSAVGLSAPKTGHNVGSVLRAAGCYGVSLVVISGKRYQRASTDTTKAYRHIPLLQCDDLHKTVPYDCVPVAVDLVPGASSLVDYIHPERAYYVFGPEDGTLGQETLKWCRDKVYIPTNGCMNLAAAVNVVLYDRLSKQLQKAKKEGKAA